MVTGKWAFVAIGIAIVALVGAAVWKARHEAAPAAKLPGEETVLATVNGLPITQYEVDRAIDSSLGDYTQSQLGKDGRRKILESLVATRAIAEAQEKALSPERALAIERKIDAYREQVLVNEYLKKHAPPEPVSSEMVKKYYDEHPERFGGTQTISYGMVFTERAPTEAERKGVLDALNAVASEKDWRDWVEDARKKGKPLTYREGILDPKALEPRLAALVKSVPAGGVSAVSFIEGKAYIVRVTGSEAGALRPLSEVSADIRRELMPIQARDAVKKASEQVLKGAKVEYR
jgi:hypothetical protein